jgi:hypothetical protein
MLSNLEILFSRLSDPGYAYLLLEPLLLHGIFFGVIFFCVGHYMGQPKCRAAALIVIILSSLGISPCLSLRDKGMHPRELEKRPADAKLIKEQYQRRADTKWIYYALAIASVLALLGGGKLAALSNLVIVGGGLLVVLFSAWMHMKEAEIYHPNIIQRAVPVK